MRTETHADEKGRLLLAVVVRPVALTIILWAFIVAAVALVAVDILRRRQLRLNGLIIFLPSLLIFAHSPRIKFHDGGVEIPPVWDDSRRRFFRWSQIARHSWDGDKLILTGTTSFLEGGPAGDAMVRIPPSRRLEVEQMLLSKLGL